MKLTTNAWVKSLLYLLIATDLSFILLHIIHSSTEFMSKSGFSLGEDRGYSEIYQYVKEYWSALLLAALAIRRRSLLYVAWSLLFFYLLLDDATSIHEKFGWLISAQIAFPSLFGLEAKHLGEIAVSAIAGLFFLLLIGITYRFSDRQARWMSKYLILLLAVLAFLGIAVDLLDALLQFSPFHLVSEILEDGGELLIMSVMLSFIFMVVNQSQKRTERSLNSESDTIHSTQALRK